MKQRVRNADEANDKLGGREFAFGEDIVSMGVAFKKKEVMKSSARNRLTLKQFRN